jgi:hypothetical protein
MLQGRINSSDLHTKEVDSYVNIPNVYPKKWYQAATGEVFDNIYKANIVTGINNFE